MSKETPIVAVTGLEQDFCSSKRVRSLITTTPVRVTNILEATTIDISKERVSRVADGMPFDHSITGRKAATSGSLEVHFPRLSEYLFNRMLKKTRDAAFAPRPEMEIIFASQACSANHLGQPRELARVMRDGVGRGVKRVTDFGLLDRSVESIRHTTAKWDAAIGFREKPLPKLCQNIFMLDYPKSVASLGCVASVTGAFPLYDLATMAMTGVGAQLKPLNHASDEQGLRRTARYRLRYGKEGQRSPRLGGWNLANNTLKFPAELGEEIDQAFRNVDTTLKAAGGKGWSQVFRVNSYHTELNPEVTKRMSENFKKYMPNHKPIWTEISVAKLGADGMNVEIEVVAHDPPA
ncbi:hypothetical protein G7046_g2523 [Stylonectria norvegica]|nr:hypothetical protein G7046_g2523 [Stylonectria norvegica]